MTYHETLNMIRHTRSIGELEKIHLENVSENEAHIIRISLRAMRKALACRTFNGVGRLQKGFTKLYSKQVGEEDWFFGWLLAPRRMELYYGSPFGEEVTRLFKTKSNHIQWLDGRFISVSGRRQ